jgi:hypothetical protein
MYLLKKYRKAKKLRKIRIFCWHREIHVRVGIPEHWFYESVFQNDNRQMITAALSGGIISENLPEIYLPTRAFRGCTPMKQVK